MFSKERTWVMWKTNEFVPSFLPLNAKNLEVGKGESKTHINLLGSKNASVQKESFALNWRANTLSHTFEYLFWKGYSSGILKLNPHYCNIFLWQFNSDTAFIPHDSLWAISVWRSWVGVESGGKVKDLVQVPGSALFLKMQLAKSCLQN